MKTVFTTAREVMAFFSFEDETALYETVLFPEIYRRYERLLSSRLPSSSKALSRAMRERLPLKSIVFPHCRGIRAAICHCSRPSRAGSGANPSEGLRASLRSFSSPSPSLRILLYLRP